MTNTQTDKKEKSQSSLQDTCLCQNKRPELVTTVGESEIVCRYCGVVFGFDEEENNNTIPYQHITKSRINLYQKRQTGGNPHDVKKITHISNLRLEKNNNSDIIPFADICDKLKLSDITSENCWKSYCDLKKQTDRFTRAKTMCLAIYQTCRESKIPFDEERVQDVICQSLGVKNVPRLKSVIFKTEQSARNSNPGNMDTKRLFYLNQHLSQAQKKHDLADITNLQHLAISYYENFIGLNDNQHHHSLMENNDNNHHNQTSTKNATTVDHNVLAKRAVSLAVLRCMH